LGQKMQRMQVIFDAHNECEGALLGFEVIEIR